MSLMTSIIVACRQINCQRMSIDILFVERKSHLLQNGQCRIKRIELASLLSPLPLSGCADKDCVLNMLKQRQARAANEGRLSCAHFPQSPRILSRSCVSAYGASPRMTVTEYNSIDALNGNIGLNCRPNRLDRREPTASKLRPNSTSRFNRLAPKNGSPRALEAKGSQGFANKTKSKKDNFNAELFGALLEHDESLGDMDGVQEMDDGVIQNNVNLSQMTLKTPKHIQSKARKIKHRAFVKPWDEMPEEVSLDPPDETGPAEVSLPPSSRHQAGKRTPSNHKPAAANPKAPPGDDCATLFELFVPETSNHSVVSDLTDLKSYDSTKKELRHRKKKNATVNFGTVDIREIERILDINPSCTNGPPLGLGWKCLHEQSLTVEEFERRKGKRRAKTDATDVLMPVPRHERESLLLELGYTRRDLAMAIRRANRIKHKRRTTINNLNTPYEKVEELAENAGKRVKKCFMINRLNQS